MHSGVVEQYPYGYSRDEVEPRPLFSELVHQENKENQDYSQSQEGQVYAPAVEQSHYQYGYKVVSDGQGREEYLQGYRDLVAEYSQYANSKSYVCGGRDSPAAA